MAGTITHQWNGTVLTITSDSGTSSSDLKGAKGDDGARGAQGAPGSSVAEDSQKLGGVAAAQYALKNNVPAYNLLDNSDFRNPVNQRGIYDTTESENLRYTIDRWISYLTSIDVSQTGMLLSGQFGSNYNTIHQYVPLTPDGRIYTAALYYADGTVKCASGDFLTNAGGIGAEYGVLLQKDSNGKPYVQLYTYDGKRIIGAALYEGAYDASTLPAYQPKGYAAELAECQRYYRPMPYPVIPCGNNPAGTQVYGFLPFRMRIDNPTVACDTLYYFKGDTTFCSVSSASAASYGAGTRIVFNLSSNVEGNLAGAVAGNGITLSADL